MQARMLMKIILLILLSALPVKAQIPATHIKSMLSVAAMSHIIGTDDRKTNGGVFSEKFPFVHTQAATSGCSGTLIARDLVLTNLHCVLYQGFPTTYTKYHQGKFESEVEGINVYISSAVSLKGNGISYTQLDDWAIIQLNEPVGDSLGFCSIAAQNPVLGRQIGLSGYHGDLNGAIGMQNNCNVKRIETKRTQDGRTGVFILNDCDSVQGSSGSSVVVENGVNCEVVALHVGHYLPSGTTLAKDEYLSLSRYNDSYASVAISVVDLLPIVNAIKSGQTTGPTFKTLHSEIQ